MISRPHISSPKQFIKNITFLFGFITHAIAYSQVYLPGSVDAQQRELTKLFVDSTSSAFLPVNFPIAYDSIREETLEVVGPTFITSYNSTYPRSYQDGSVWRGRGITQEIHAGLQLTKGKFFLSLHPVLLFSQNQSFDLAESLPFRNPLNYQFRPMSGSAANIDFVQRYGTKSYLKFHPGQSEIKFQFKWFHAGLSTQNFTIGPGQQNHLLMSNHAGGFPHIYVGTPDYIPIKIKSLNMGKVYGNMFHGLLNESEYFDEDAENDLRYIQGISFGYQPPFLQGLSLGFNKVLYKDNQYFEFQDVYAAFHVDDDGLVVDANGDTLFNTGNDTFDQLASVYIQYFLQQAKARVYFELGKNDFNGDFRRGITEFEHNRMYTIGLEKAGVFNKKKWILGYEHTYLPFFKNYIYRPTSSAYTHSVNKQGYTNDGQLVGAGIGPGSVSDYLRFSVMDPDRFVDVTLQRIRFDEDYFITQLPNVRDKMNRHDVEFTLGLAYARRFNLFLVQVKTEYSYRYNMYFEKNNDRFNLLAQIMIRRELK